MFTAYYDLACSPPTFDVVAFLCAVERARGEEDVEIVFLPGPRGGFRDDNLWPHSLAERVHMRQCVAVPLCWLLPAVRSVRVLHSRDEAPLDGWGVGQSIYGLKTIADCSRSGIRPLRSSGWLPAASRLVTITLRESEHWPERNSRVDEWLKAAEQIKARGWDVVFIRDTLHTEEALPGVTIDPLAACDIAHRAHLYAHAAVNLCVSNGPGWLALTMNAPLLMFRPVGTSAPQFSEEFFSLYGVQAGGQFPGCEMHQRLAWCDDTADEIVAAFDAYVADNELSPDNAPRVRTACNTDEATIIENVRSACRRGLASVAAASAHDGHAVLVGGGPSLASTLGEIKRRAADGQTIFALNGAGNWLAERGVHPDHIVMLDPRPGNARFVGLPTCYLLASQCAPEVFDAALASKGAVLMWHFADPAIADVVEQEAPGSWGCTGTLTVGLTAMMLVHCMGYRKIHLYGYDSSDADGEGHAYAQAETTAEAKRITVMCGGRKFSASAPMYAQVCAFEPMARALAERDAIITIHGDGLLPTYARSMNPIQESLAA